MSLALEWKGLPSPSHGGEKRGRQNEVNSRRKSVAETRRLRLTFICFICVAAFISGLLILTICLHVMVVQNEMKIRDLEEQTELERRQQEAVRVEVASLEDRIDHLTLVNMAMWSLLQEKTGLTEQDLLDRVRQIDLQDGVEDGKARKQIAKCPKCGRTMSPRHRRCLYCGAGELNYTAFDSVR